MRIPVSCAGMAGLWAVVNLGAAGHEITIIERALPLRVNGSPIDIRGQSLAMAQRMGEMTARSCFVDAGGNRVADVPVADINDSAEDAEIPREDLAAVLVIGVFLSNQS